jgi:heme-degrading monooxygenase HmoA
MRCQCHLAQINIARARAPIDDPLMSGFVARLEDVNALADASPGFVWRLETEEGNATSLQPYDDPRVMVNMSVWETPDHLKHFVYKSAHTDVMRQRRQWFERMSDVHMAMWWIERGHVPTVAEALERLHYLQVHGESEFAFSFASLFPAPAMRMPDTLEPV